MATSIGQINFSVEANTAGLRKAVAQLKEFQKQTDKVARSQVKGSQAASAAMARQETAVRKGLQSVVNLRREINKSNLTEEKRRQKLLEVTNSFKILTREMTSGRLNVAKYNRSLDTFNAKMARTKRSIKEVGTESTKTRKFMAFLPTLMRDLESSAVLALGPLSGVGARVRSLGAIFSRSTFLIAGAVAAIAVFVIALSKLASLAVRSGEAVASLNLRFEAATGSAAKAGKQLKFTIQLSKRLGLEVESLAKSYSRFLAATQGTNLEGEKAQKIFTQVARAAAGLKLNAQDVEGVMRAIEQIMSKGTVQAEELRGQLGDRLPGAFRIAAEAMGVTTQELNRMLKAGEVSSEEFLPKFADALTQFGKNAEKNAGTVGGAFNNLKTQIFEFGAQLNKLPGAVVDILPGIEDSGVTASAVFASMISAVQGYIEWITPGTTASREFGDAVEEVEEQVEQFRIAIDGTRVPVVELTGAFAKINEEAKDAEAELKAMEEAIGFFGDIKHADINFLLDFFKAMPKLAEAGAGDLQTMSEFFEHFLQQDIAPTVEGVAAGFAEMQRRIAEANEEIDRLRKAPEVLEDITADLERLRMRAAAFREGAEQGKNFDKVTDKVETLRRALLETTLTEEERAAILEETRALLAEIAALTAKYKDETKKLTATERAAARALEKRNNAIREAAQQIAILEDRVKAMAKGPDALERFQKVDQPIARMRDRLIEAGVAGKELEGILGRYEELLEVQLRMTDRIARANQAMADAMVNGLEQVLLEGKSVRDMLHDLANELLRVAIRALFLDRLKASLFGLFQGGLFPGVLRSPAGGGGGGGGITPGGGGFFARGGSFKLSGSGGADKIPFFGVGKAGETVTVSRPDQMSAVGGVTIIQNNSFEGGISDPATLIPILEENNRKLKGEILIGLDRGSFR